MQGDHTTHFLLRVMILWIFFFSLLLCVVIFKGIVTAMLNITRIKIQMDPKGVEVGKF